MYMHVCFISCTLNVVIECSHFVIGSRCVDIPEVLLDEEA